MTIPAWQLITWKAVFTTLPQFRRAVARMGPLGEPAADVATAGGLRHGQALWAAEHDGCPLGLAWDWAEVRADVVALCDPMNVLSNVHLVDDEGTPLDDAARIVHLNSAVHELNWQAHARRASARAAHALAA